MMRWLLPILVLFCCCWLWGCGSAGTDNSYFTSSGAGGSNPTSTGPAFRILGELVSKTVGPTGGAIEAVATDGTRFVLTIPAGALSQDTPLTMLPVAVSGQLGLPIELPVAVKISPSGTQFTGGAELAITLPAGTNVSNYHAYVMEDSGTPMSLAFAKIVGQTITFKVFHLTVPGASPAPVPSPAQIGVTSAAQVVEAQIAAAQAAFAAGQLSQADYNTLLNNLANDYFEQTLKPLMQQTAINGNDTLCQFVLREAVRFESFLQFANIQSAASFTPKLEPLYVNLLKRGIVALGEEAVAANDYLRLKPVVDFYLVQAQLRNLDTQANGLDHAKVRSMIPLTVVLEILEKPEILDENETGKIRIKAGYRLGNNAVKYVPRVFAQLDMTGGQLPNPQVDKLKQATAGTGAIDFDNITLSANSQKIDVHLTGIFQELVFPQAGLIETPGADFVIEGKLKVTVNSGASSGATTPVTATVRKGKAPLASAPVTFEVISGGGTIPTTGTTNAQGAVTQTHNAPAQSSNIVKASSSNGSQTASGTVTFNSGYQVDPSLANFTGQWQNDQGPVQYRFSGDWTTADKAAWSGYTSGPDFYRAQLAFVLGTGQQGSAEVGFNFGSLPDPSNWQLSISGNRTDDNGNTFQSSPLIRLPQNKLGYEGQWSVNGVPRVQVSAVFANQRIEAPPGQLVEYDPLLYVNYLAQRNDPDNALHLTIRYLYRGNLEVSFELPPFLVLPDGIPTPPPTQF